jgi:hypothetical protein
MLAAMLFAISIVALSQFAAYYWRATLSGTAAQPISDRMLVAIGVQNGQLTGQNFATLLSIHDLTPELNSGSHGLFLVRVYYRMIDAMATLLGRSMPAIAAWSERELTVCARYAAVQIDRRWQENLELAASLRSC